MKRFSGLMLVAAALLVPVAVHAQKPSDNSETRSADVYMQNAEKSQLTSEKNELYKKAIAIALQGAAKDPSNPKPWFQIGTAYQAMGDFVGADTSFAKAQAMYPEYASKIDPERSKMWTLIYNEGAKKIRAADAAGGIEQFKLAAHVYPARFEAFQAMGSIYLQTGDLKNAEQAYREELAVLRGPERKKLDPKKEAEWADAELNAVKALATMMSELDRYADAESLYRELLARDPQNPVILSNLAITLTRAKKDTEANTIYTQLLGRTDLTGNQLLNVGIGLHNAGDYEKAAKAFERAAGLNPYSHDILDFRVRALTGAVEDLASQRTKPGADTKALDAKIMATNALIIEAGRKLLAIDPGNAPVILQVAEAQRQSSLTDVANAKKWKDDVLATLTMLDKMPYSVVNVQSQADEKTITLTGSVMGLEKSKPGTNATLRFTLVDKDGKSVGTKDVTAVVPAKEQMTPFTVTIDAPASAVAYKYEIIS
jgi:tetratricopeptide (TPR) repeat protein